MGVFSTKKSEEVKKTDWDFILRGLKKSFHGIWFPYSTNLLSSVSWEALLQKNNSDSTWKSLP